MADEFDLSGDGWGSSDFGQPAGDAGADSAGQAADKGAPAEPELTTEQALEKAFDEQSAGTDDAKSESAWQRELRRMADETLRNSGVDPERRHELGVSRREVVRRLHAAEAMIRQDLGQGLSAIVSGYGNSLSPEQRGAAARAVLNAFGFQDAGGIAAHERERLQQYDAQAQAEAAAYQQAMPRAQATLDTFAASHEHFAVVGRVMGHLMTAAREAGSPIGLEQAYEQACRARGLATSEDAARAADDARRSKVANARAAGTPQTKSAPGRHIDRAGPDKGVAEILEQQWDQLVGA